MKTHLAPTESLTVVIDDKEITVTFLREKYSTDKRKNIPAILNDFKQIEKQL